MNDEILEGEVIEPGMESADQHISADFEAFDEKDLNPLLKTRARDFEQRLNLLTDYQQALLRIMPDEVAEMTVVDSKPTVPLVRQLIEACGETLVHLGTLLLTNTDMEEDIPTPVEKGQIELPFDKPFVFCYQDEGGEDEPTE